MTNRGFVFKSFLEVAIGKNGFGSDGHFSDEYLKENGKIDDRCEIKKMSLDEKIKAIRKAKWWLKYNGYIEIYKVDNPYKASFDTAYGKCTRTYNRVSYEYSITDKGWEVANKYLGV